MPKLIGTAGHVDHGKTTLIQALTGIDADRLPEEKRRGMTIDIGFAYFDLPEVGRVSIVDVPGHERFVTNMLVGALGVDVAMLCVAADEGVKPQTREHLAILELLPVEQLVVALTRADLADEETRELSLLDVNELLEKSRFKDAVCIFVSPQTGEGLGELKETLHKALLASGGKDEQLPWYLPIDRVFAVKGHGCVVTGTLAQGRVAVGDEGLLVPGQMQARVRSIQSHDESFGSAGAGRRVALNLSGVKLEEVRRGQSIGAPGALFETSLLDAQVTWTIRPKHAQRIRLSLGAEEAIGRAFLSDTDETIVQLRLETAVACALHQPVIIRRYSPPDVLGGGRVLVPQARPRRKSAAAEVVQSSDDAEAVLEVLSGTGQGVSTEEICRRLGRTPQQLGDVFERLSKRGVIAGFAGLWFSSQAFDESAAHFLEALAKLHEEKPMLAAIPREQVAERAKLKWGGKPLDRILAALADRERIAVSGSSVRLPEFKVQLTPKQSTFLERVVAELDKAGVNAPFASDLAQELKVPPQAVDEILKLGVQSGRIVRVFEGIYYSTEKLEELKSSVKTLAGSKPFSAAKFRDAIGTTRKYAIPLLEYFDAIGFTMRLGDERVIK